MKPLSVPFSSIAVLFFICACSKDKTVPVSDQIKKVWLVQSVRENNTLVYTKGASTNIRNYSGFRLNLSGSPAITLTEIDGNSFSGQYEVLGENRLLLKNLNPQPTGTNGAIEYTITSISSSELNLTRTSGNPKTGGTSNQYQLTSN